MIGLEVIVLVRPIENWWAATSSQSVGPMGLKTTNEKRQYLSHVGCYSRARPADEPLKNGGDGGGSRHDRSMERPSGVKRQGKTENGGDLEVLLKGRKSPPRCDVTERGIL